jgi:hypothetical protein
MIARGYFDFSRLGSVISETQGEIVRKQKMISNLILWLHFLGFRTKAWKLETQELTGLQKPGGRA